MCCKKLFIFLPRLSSSKLDNHCKILHKSWILKPSKDLSCGRDNPLREHSNPDQEQEQDGQEGDGGGHVVDGRPQGDEVDDDAGSCSQHLFNLSKSHNHNTMSKDFTPRPHLAFLVTKSRATSGLKPTLGFFQRPMPGHTVWPLCDWYDASFKTVKSFTKENCQVATLVSAFSRSSLEGRVTVPGSRPNKRVFRAARRKRKGDICIKIKSPNQ